MYQVLHGHVTVVELSQYQDTYTHTYTERDTHIQTHTTNSETTIHNHILTFVVFSEV